MLLHYYCDAGGGGELAAKSPAVHHGMAATHFHWEFARQRAVWSLDSDRVRPRLDMCVHPHSALPRMAYLPWKRTGDKPFLAVQMLMRTCANALSTTIMQFHHDSDKTMTYVVS